MKLKSIMALSILALALFPLNAQDAKSLVSEMIEAIGGKKHFYGLKNVN